MTERTRPRVLLIDDSESYAQVVREQLTELQLVCPRSSRAGRFVDGPTALAHLRRDPGCADVVLLDMHFDLPDAQLLPLPEAGTLRRRQRFQGVAILRALRAQHPHLPVVLLTSERDLSLGDVAAELTSQSMTYLLDGDDLDALRIRIHSALSDARLGTEERGVLWGLHPELAAMRRRLAVLSRGGLPLLLEGETGTGKSFIAERFVHPNSGRKGPFVVLDLSTLPETLVAAHLFGAVRGAYTGAVSEHRGVFEAADGGTLFIDEIQNAPPDVQKQLLLVLQSRSVTPLGSTRARPVDVKIVAASNTSLQQAVAAGRFRADLYMRLSPATRVRLPPLRERPEDLEFLARSFVQRAFADPDLGPLCERVATAVGAPKSVPVELRLDTRGVPAADAAQREPGSGLALVLPLAAASLLREHDWPGNIRELEVVMRNLLSFTLLSAVDALDSGVRLRSGRLQVDAGLVGELLAGSRGLLAPAAQAVASSDPTAFAVRLGAADTLNAVTKDVERQYMVALFERSEGDLSRMAQVLLGDAGRERAVRLRLNQLGLKIRNLREP